MIMKWRGKDPWIIRSFFRDWKQNTFWCFSRDTQASPSTSFFHFSLKFTIRSTTFLGVPDVNECGLPSFGKWQPLAFVCILMVNRVEESLWLMCFGCVEVVRNLCLSFPDTTFLAVFLILNFQFEFRFLLFSFFSFLFLFFGHLDCLNFSFWWVGISSQTWCELRAECCL